MANPTPATSSGASPTNGKKPRKVSERIPRTPEEVAFGNCANILKKIPAEMRARVMRSLVALYSST